MRAAGRLRGSWAALTFNSLMRTETMNRCGAATASSPQTPSETLFGGGRAAPPSKVRFMERTPAVGDAPCRSRILPGSVVSDNWLVLRPPGRLGHKETRANCQKPHQRAPVKSARTNQKQNPPGCEMSGLAGLIHAEIEAGGPISFARFMELALYHPEFGYYERRSPVGRQGDYYTSVSAGGLFGELLAFAFAQWGAGLDDGPLQIVESGAHDGRLARDIVDWVNRREGGRGQIEYWILEPSIARRAWQKETLGPCANSVRWASDWDRLPACGVQGVIFANELLDAMPARRWVWDAAAMNWREWGVGRTGDGFAWVRLDRPQSTGPDSSPVGLSDLNEFFPLDASLLAVLPDGFIVETCPAALTWWRNAAARLRRGWLLTFDYGLTFEELLSPSRSQGTLRAYHNHQVSNAVLDRPGEHDLTAHVNFSAIRAAGEAAGLKTEHFESQGSFLVRVVGEIERQSGRFGDWTPGRRRQLKTLVHPEHLGHAFRVLAQSRQAR